MLKKLLFSLSFSLSFLFAFSQAERFYHYGKKEGLSQESVQTILKSNDGFLWLGTQDGLNRFDGKQFKVFKHHKEAKNSISGNFITSLLENQEQIWIGTSNNGVSIYDINQDAFKSIGTKNGNITAIAKDSKAKVYVGYLSEGLSVFNLKKDTILEKNISLFKGNHLKITSVAINNKDMVYVGTKSGRLFVSNDGSTFKEITFYRTIGAIQSLFFDQDKIWIGTSKGVFYYDNNKLKSVKIPKSFNKRLENAIIYAIAKHKNKYYFATDDGLFICSDFSNEQQQFNSCKNYIGDKNNINSITSNRVYDILIDEGLLWIGTNKLDLLSLEPLVFNSINVKSKPKINNNHIYSIYKTPTFLFIGTRNGLNCIDNNGKSFFITKENTGGKLAFNVIRSIAYDNENLWIGTTKGVSIIDLKNFNPKHPKIKTFHNNLSDTTSISHDNIRNIFLDKHHQIWISTFGGGLNLFTGDVAANKFTFKHFTHQNNSNSVSSDFIFNVTQDNKGDYWIASKFGLTKMQYNPFSKKAFFNTFQKGEGKNQLSSNNILTTYHDKNDKMWIGTQNGLFLLDKKNNNFTAFGEKQGLTNNVIYSILEDNDNNLWMSTNSGLFRLNKKTLQFINFTNKDGLRSSEYNLGAQFKDSISNLLYFGGTNGVDYFNPKDIKNLYQEGDLKFTSLYIKDTYIQPSKSNPIINKNITKAKKIRLSYNDFPLYLTFSDLNFKPYKNSSFYYKLAPNDANWNAIKKGNQIQLLNLSPGEYTLQLQGKSHQNFWSKKPLEIQLSVSPPWYASNFAFVIYFLLASSLLFLITKYFIERKLEHQEMLRLKELDTLKTTLYTNITHEFRTPITVILGMAQNIKEKLKEHKINATNELNLIENNSNSLLRLVNQILDLSKLKKGKLKLKLEQGDLVKYIKYLTESFSSFAQEKEVTLLFYSEEEEILMDYDADKIKQIISNLISNAIKFCDKNDKIVIHLSKDKNNLILKVQDSGIGIKAENLPFIFDRFYQAENKDTKKYDGTGIGLALTKELITLMDGTIEVKSKMNSGTTFIIALPIKNEAVVSQVPEVEIESIPQSIEIISNQKDKNKKELPIALVVEDNKDVAQYIFSCIEKQYQILYAENGEIGLKLALEEIPDIIISDIMMPKKDGYELCEIVKKDIKTNHIPIILLTAKATSKDKIDGLKTGADAYLTKPFNKEELLVRMHQLIALRKALQQKYQNIEKLVDDAKEDFFEDIFIKNVITEIQKNIDDSNFDAKQLAKNLHLSDSQLYRKLKASTDLSVALFIRKIKLQKAKELLKNSDLTISEVCYATGFNNPSWFSKIFKKEFGYSPKHS